MRSRRAGVGTALLVILACCVPQQGHAAALTKHKPGAMLPPVGDYPDAECTNEIGAGGAGPGDIYIGQDAHFWECICEERVFTDNDCAWYDQGALPGAELRRLKRKLHRSAVPRGRVIDTQHWRLLPL